MGSSLLEQGMRFIAIIVLLLMSQLTLAATNYSIPALAVPSKSSISADFIQLSPMRELKEKIEMMKVLVKDTCFDPTDSNSDSVYFSTTNSVFNISSGNQRWIASWGCTASDGTNNDVVAGYALFKDAIGMFDEMKVVLVGLDQTNVKIQTTSFDTNDRISAWCVSVIDNNNGDSVAISANLDIDGDGSTELTIQRLLQEIACS